jgi:hypothetical protein
MKTHILFLITFTSISLFVGSLFSQTSFNCPSVNCQNATAWETVNNAWINDVIVTETTSGTPPVTVTCTTRVYYNYRWRICNGIREFELLRFWWDYNLCPVDHADPDFLVKMRDLHNRLFPLLVWEFYHDPIAFPVSNFACPPYCCPNNPLALVTTYASSCYSLAIEWYEELLTGGRVLHSLPVSSQYPINYYLGQVPQGVNAYIAIGSCISTGCCKRNYKLCVQPGTAETLIIEDSVEQLPSPYNCYPDNTCFPRCSVL